ncbi:MAG: hypothetical protein ACXVRE_07540 [Gaiellaceae bacterium]
MELVLGTMSFSAPGGSETYLLTVAEQLQRLGHEVTLFTVDAGQMATFAEDRGIRVATSLHALPAACDAALVQDGVVAYRLAERYPDTPQVFRAASDLSDLQLPPGLPGVTSAVVALSERVAARVRRLAAGTPVTRLRQPIDTERFTPASPLATTARRALLLGNYLQGERRDAVLSAFAAAGIDAVQVGRPSSFALRPERAMWESDIVVAKGRSALEAMACGRAVYVYDRFGSDGWVTPEAYPAMEADNFAGQATAAVADAERVQSDLADYDASMGVVNRDLVLHRHGARRHAQELCELFGDVPPPEPAPEAPLRELARLVRLQWQTESRAAGLEEAHADVRTRLDALELEHAALSGEHAALSGEHEELRHRYEALAAEHRALSEHTTTRRYRFGMTLGRLADSLRRAVGLRR